MTELEEWGEDEVVKSDEDIIAEVYEKLKELQIKCSDYAEVLVPLIEERDKAINKIKDDFNLSNKELIANVSESKLKMAECDRRLRELVVKSYNFRADKSRKQFGNKISVKVGPESFDYEDEAAVKWALEHNPHELLMINRALLRIWHGLRRWILLLK